MIRPPEEGESAQVVVTWLNGRSLRPSPISSDSAGKCPYGDSLIVYHLLRGGLADCMVIRTRGRIERWVLIRRQYHDKSYGYREPRRFDMPDCELACHPRILSVLLWPPATDALVGCCGLQWRSQEGSIPTCRASVHDLYSSVMCRSSSDRALSSPRYKLYYVESRTSIRLTYITSR